MVSYDDYMNCMANVTSDAPDYNDHLTHTMRSYSVWYYAYTVGKNYLYLHDCCTVYFIILFRPFNWLYLASGILMTITLLAGYAICILNIVFLSQTKCDDTSYAKMTATNTIVFLVCGSYTLLFTHIALFLPKLKEWCSKIKAASPRSNTMKVIQ